MVATSVPEFPDWWSPRRKRPEVRCCAKNAGVCPAGLPQELFLDSQTPPYSALQTLLVVLRQDMMRSTNIPALVLHYVGDLPGLSNFPPAFQLRT